MFAIDSRSCSMDSLPSMVPSIIVASSTALAARSASSLAFSYAGSMALRSSSSSLARATILLVQLTRTSQARPLASSSARDVIPRLAKTQRTTAGAWTRRMPIRRSMAIAARWGEFIHTFAAVDTITASASSPASVASFLRTSKYRSRAMRVCVKLFAPATKRVRSAMERRAEGPPSSSDSRCSSIHSRMDSGASLARTMPISSPHRRSSAPGSPPGGSPGASAIGCSSGCGSGLGGRSGTKDSGTDLATRS
mmetsp:Transcript_10933/g.25976  ORF Transcript_10933/g.25976 Transcript_10933/m.25976 type:complete len:252 (+) Transcript_10933:613-1368(+)